MPPSAEERKAARAELAQQALTLYQDDKLTLMQVADKLAVSYGKAHSLIKEAGGTMRKRGGKTKT